MRERPSTYLGAGVPVSFNSRSREGATGEHFKKVVDLKVSIHAPVRERLIGSGIYMHNCSFNSRSREGATF